MPCFIAKHGFFLYVLSFLKKVKTDRIKAIFEVFNNDGYTVISAFFVTLL